jgi:hypothetical protein
MALALPHLTGQFGPSRTTQYFAGRCARPLIARSSQEGGFKLLFWEQILFEQFKCYLELAIYL